MHRNTWLFIVVGLITLIGCAVDVGVTMSFRSGAVPVDGRVVSVRTSTAAGTTDTDYVPTFAYVVNGRTLTSESLHAKSDSEIPVGTSQALLVDAENPSNVRPNSFGGLWTRPLLLGFGGVALLVAAFVSERLMRRDRTSIREAAGDDALTTNDQA